MSKAQIPSTRPALRFPTSGIWTGSRRFLATLILLIITALLLLMASIIWSVIITQAASINSVHNVGGLFITPSLLIRFQDKNISVGITVQQGNAPYLLWATFPLIVVAMFPYWLRYVLSNQFQQRDCLIFSPLVIVPSADIE